MNELEELLKQRKELDKKIEELKNKAFTKGNVRYEVSKLYGRQAHVVRIKKMSFYKGIKGYNEGRYTNKRFSIIEALSKEETKDNIKRLIEDLKDLLDELEEQGEYDD